MTVYENVFDCQGMKLCETIVQGALLMAREDVGCEDPLRLVVCPADRTRTQAWPAGLIDPQGGFVEVSRAGEAGAGTLISIATGAAIVRIINLAKEV